MVKERAKRQRVSQGNVPRASLRKALDIPRALHEQYAGDPTAPLDVASALEVSPSTD